MSIVAIVLTILATLALAGCAIYLVFAAEIRRDDRRKPRSRSHHDDAIGKSDDARRTDTNWAHSFDDGGSGGSDD